MNGMFRRKVKGVHNHAVFRTLYTVHHVCLFLNWHIFVNNSDSALTGNGYRHLCLCHRIHRRRHKRNIQMDFFRQLRTELNFFGQNMRFCGNQQNIVKRKGLFYKLLLIVRI